jgi:hypothetical protein
MGSLNLPAAQKPPFHPGSHSVREQEQVWTSCIRQRGMPPKELSLLQEAGIS